MPNPLGPLLASIVLALLLTGCSGPGTQMVDRTAQLAEEGNVDAQFSLALMYHYGTGVETDPAAATSWYEKAAEQGHIDAQYYAGAAYRDGAGVEANIQRAATLFERAAERGHASAQYWLGRLHDGAGAEADSSSSVPLLKDDKSVAGKWYRLAAEQGHPGARYHLGYLHRYGLGMPVDLVEAYFWWELARHRYDQAGFEQKKLAIEIGEDGEFTMSRGMVEEAKLKADLWIEAHPESGLRARPKSRRLSQ